MADYGLNVVPEDIDLNYLEKRRRELQKEIWRIESIIERLKLSERLKK